MMSRSCREEKVIEQQLVRGSMRTCRQVLVVLTAALGGWLVSYVLSPSDLVAEEQIPKNSVEREDRFEAIERRQRRQLSILAALQTELGSLRRLQPDDEGGAFSGGMGSPHEGILDASEPSPETIPEELHEPSPEAVAAQEEATRIFEVAKSSGSWTDDDNEQMAEKLRAMPLDQADAARQKLIVALNRGELRADFSGPPLF
jgi:hypothetical protein